MTEYTAPVGAPIWMDLVSSDPARATEFYSAVFGWEVEAPPQGEFGGYQNFTLNGRRVAGLVPPMGEDAGPTDIWSVYLHTADAAATVKAVEAAGGSVVVPPMPVADLGSMLVVVDSAGAVIGFWQPGTHTGFAEWASHGAPYWFECHSRDYDSTCAFYTAVVGARLEEVQPGDADGAERYSQVFVGDLSYSGVMDATKNLPAGVPSTWLAYITVDDAEATVAQAEKLGAEIVMGAVPTPYGTLASLKDPLGAVFCVGQPPAQG
jgi:predicted enzyme related to lactoylglutathione lyase